MSNRRSRGSESRYSSSSDADFGVFQPMEEQAANYQPYMGWTQFSGMPPSPSDSSQGYGWDRFVTPPNTAGVDMAPPDANQIYLNELNKIMAEMEKHNAGNFDPSQDADKLANTPVAQSLLEALSSNPNGIIGAMGDPSSLDFNSFSQDGYEMYADALSKLGDPSYQTYSPFSTPDVLNASPSSTPPPPGDQDLASNHSSKPSYSEVAKSFKSNSSGKETDESDSSKMKASESQGSKSAKSSKKFVPRPVRGRNNSSSDDLRPTISPDSKYGLDDFGDEVKNKDKKGHPPGFGNIPLTRKNSSSSISSGASGIEEINLKPKETKTCYEEPLQFEKISNKEKERDEKSKNANKAQPKPFFDPRKIFQTKDTNKRRSQPKNVENDSGPQILNNGKPAYTAWCPNSTHKKSTNYINNNLRDTQKKTNQAPGKESKEHQPADTDFPQPHTRHEKSSRGRTNSAKGSTSSSSSSSAKPEMPMQTSFDHELIGEGSIDYFSCNGSQAMLRNY